MRRIPRIKFPQRHPKTSGVKNQTESVSTEEKNDDLVRTFFSRAPSNLSVGGKASDQPKELQLLKRKLMLSCWGAVFDYSCLEPADDFNR